MLMTSHASIESHASQEKSAIDTFSLMASTYASFSQGLLAYSFLPTCNQHSRTCTNRGFFRVNNPPRQANRDTQPAPHSLAENPLPVPPGLQTDRPRPPIKAAFTVPVHSGKKRGVRCDPGFSTEAETRAERTHGLPGCASRCRSNDLSGASACGRHYALRPVTSTHV